MGIGKIDEGTYTDMTNQVTAYSSPAADTTSEVEFQDTRWSEWLGIYNDIIPIKGFVDRKAFWVVGKGYKASKKTKNRLDKIRGNGFDTFNSILLNAVKVYTMSEAGFFAEIIRTKRGELLNLKPLNPGIIKVKANDRGIITGFEQWANGKLRHRWRPEEMFYLPWNRIADSIHGTSTIKRLEWESEAYKEAKEDMRIVFHRYVKPLIISHVDTDDPTEITNFKQKLDKAVELGENLVLPYDTLKNMERMSIPQHSSLDPMPWLEKLERDFLIADGVPSIILGSAEKGDKEATVKVLYLAYQQNIEANQMFLEEQIRAQLGVEIELEFPASLEPTMQKDQSKSRSINNMEAGIGEASGGKK